MGMIQEKVDLTPITTHYVLITHLTQLCLLVCHPPEGHTA